MKYNFKAENVNTDFHAFGQIEGQKEKIIEALSIYNVLCDYYYKEDAREMVNEVEYGNPEEYADLINFMYTDLTREDCLPENIIYFLKDLDMYFQIWIEGKEITTGTLQICDYPIIKRDWYKAEVIKI